MKFKKLAKCSLATALVFGGAITVSSCGKDDDVVETTQLEETYKLYVQYMNDKEEKPLTYEEWLASIKGEKGDKGDKPEIIIGSNGNWFIDGVDTHVSSRGPQGLGIQSVSKSADPANEKIDVYTITYTNNQTYTFRVQNGNDGKDGKNVKFRFNEDTGYLQWAYDVPVAGAFQWNNLTHIDNLKGDNAKTPIIAVEDGILQWRYTDENTWHTLFDLNSLKGENGTTWLTGSGAPTTSEDRGKIGDFYFDTENDDIYIYTDDGWMLEVDLKSEENENSKLSPGIYTYTEKGVDYKTIYEFSINEESHISSFVAHHSDTFPVGANLAEYGLVPIHLDENTNTIVLGFGSAGNESIGLVDSTIYTIDCSIYDGNLKYRISGKVNGNLEVVEDVYATTHFETDVSKISYEMIGEGVKFTINHGDYLEVSSFKFGDTYLYNDLKARELIPAVLFSKDDEVLVYGAYEDSANEYEQASLSISKTRALLKLNYTYLSGTYEFFEGSIEGGNLGMKVYTDAATLYVGLDIYDKSFHIIDIEYNYTGKYTDGMEENVIALSRVFDDYILNVNGVDMSVDSISFDRELVYVNILGSDGIKVYVLDSLKRQYYVEDNDGGENEGDSFIEYSLRNDPEYFKIKINDTDRQVKFVREDGSESEVYSFEYFEGQKFLIISDENGINLKYVELDYWDSPGQSYNVLSMKATYEIHSGDKRSGEIYNIYVSDYKDTLFDGSPYLVEHVTNGDHPSKEVSIAYIHGPILSVDRDQEYFMDVENGLLVKGLHLSNNIEFNRIYINREHKTVLFNYMGGMSSPLYSYRYINDKYIEVLNSGDSLMKYLEIYNTDNGPEYKSLNFVTYYDLCDANNELQERYQIFSLEINPSDVIDGDYLAIILDGEGQHIGVSEVNVKNNIFTIGSKKYLVSNFDNRLVLGSVLDNHSTYTRIVIDHENYEAYLTDEEGNATKSLYLSNVFDNYFSLFTNDELGHEPFYLKMSEPGTYSFLEQSEVYYIEDNFGERRPVYVYTNNSGKGIIDGEYLAVSDYFDMYYKIISIDSGLMTIGEDIYWIDESTNELFLIDQGVQEYDLYSSIDRYTKIVFINDNVARFIDEEGNYTEYTNYYRVQEKYLIVDHPTYKEQKICIETVKNSLGEFEYVPLDFYVSGPFESGSTYEPPYSIYARVDMMGLIDGEYLIGETYIHTNPELQEVRFTSFAVIEIANNRFTFKGITFEINPGPHELTIVRNSSDVSIDLMGEKVVFQSYYDSYMDPGANIHKEDNSSIPELTIEAEISEMREPGIYYVVYSAKDDSGKEYAREFRVVIIMDIEPPTIYLNGEEEIAIEVGEKYVELGAHAHDVGSHEDINVVIDGFVNINQAGAYTITYTATDAFGNTASVIRKVKVVDKVTPTISLIGPATMELEVNSVFLDLGAFVEDNEYEQYTISASKIYFEDSMVEVVDTAKAGTYKLIYSYTDASGNLSEELIRTVVVVNPSRNK